MGKKGHSKEAILRVLPEAESGETVVQVCRNNSIRQQTFYLWKKNRAERAGRAAAVARGEREAEAAGGGPEPGPACIAGDRRKKL